MKVCPVCNESFGDELNFCDVDGTKLRRQQDASSVGGQNKAWSLLGVALLLGALAISAASIFFLPRARVTPTVANSAEVSAPDSAQPAPADSTASTATPVAASEEGAVASTDEVAAVDPKKREKALTVANQNPAAPAPNPKAAAQNEEESLKAAPPAEEPKPAPPEPKKVEQPVPVKTAVDSRDNEGPAKPAQTVSEARKDPKKQSSGSKDSNDKKKDDKEKKKKGGFFSAFKKIFGKD